MLRDWLLLEALDGNGSKGYSGQGPTQSLSPLFAHSLFAFSFVIAKDILSLLEYDRVAKKKNE